MTWAYAAFINTRGVNFTNIEGRALILQRAI